EVTSRECPWRVARSCPNPQAHSRTDPSKLALARIWPSGLKATQVTLPPYGVSVPYSRRATASHSLTVRSLLALATILPSGLKHRQVTESVCPCRVARSRWHQRLYRPQVKSRNFGGQASGSCSNSHPFLGSLRNTISAR